MTGRQAQSRALRTGSIALIDDAGGKRREDPAFEGRGLFVSSIRIATLQEIFKTYLLTQISDPQ